MKILLLTILLFTFGFLNSQVTPGAFKGHQVTEYVWSKTKNEYVFLEKLTMEVRVVLTEKTIYFQKGEDAPWLQNAWYFEKREKKGDKIFADTYSDERKQFIVIDYESGKLYYYYNWSLHLNTHANLAIYSITEVDPSVDIDELTQDKPERFTLEFSHVATYDNETSEWSDWIKIKNSFTFNANKNGDIVHEIGGSETKIFTKNSTIKTEKLDGNEFQIFDAIDFQGNRVRIQVYNDESLGVKLIYDSIIFQFSNVKE
jgi:lipopolysaccharide export LptBFGC system permease protein LptF